MRFGVRLGMKLLKRDRKNIRRVITHLASRTMVKLRRASRSKDFPLGNEMLRIKLGTANSRLKQKNIVITRRVQHLCSLVVYWYQLDRKTFLLQIDSALKNVKATDYLRTKYIQMEATNFVRFPCPLLKFKTLLPEEEFQEELAAICNRDFIDCPIYEDNMSLFPIVPFKPDEHLRRATPPPVFVRQADRRQYREENQNGTNRLSKPNRFFYINFPKPKNPNGSQRRIEEFFSPVARLQPTRVKGST